MLTPAQLLEILPHKRPFRFVDRIVEVDDEHALTEYTFRADEFFYAGHFPGKPITPGVILLETMCQAAAVLGLQLLGLSPVSGPRPPIASVFTEAHIELDSGVRPTQTVRARAEKVFWRRNKLNARVLLALADGTPVATGSAAGMVREGV
jgi:3-hydroxyacyl-[acyl-carrier-protein] dehydratase